MQLNMPQGVTKLSHEIYDIHMMMFYICMVIGIGVFGAMIYAMIRFRKSKGAVAAQFHENTKLEILWTVIPFMILIAAVIPATATLIHVEDRTPGDLMVQITGYQWKWQYKYLGTDVAFFSTLDRKTNQARRKGSGIDPRTVPHYLLNVDKPLVIPAQRKVRFAITSNDVSHSWWVPDFGIKKDAITGYINDSWVEVDKPGVYRGQCAELCGRDHAYMPIVVVVLPPEDFDRWLEQAKSNPTQYPALAMAGEHWPL